MNHSKIPASGSLGIDNALKPLLPEMFHTNPNGFMAKVVSSHNDWVVFETKFALTHLTLPFITNAPVKLFPGSIVCFDQNGMFTQSPTYAGAKRSKTPRPKLQPMTLLNDTGRLP